MSNKAIFIAVGACVVLAGLVGWALLAFFILHSGILSPQGGAHDASGFVVRFGILEVDSSKNLVLAKETTTIPMKLQDTGFEYGIVIVPPDDKPFTYRMVLHFSSSPKVVTGNGFESHEPSTTMRTPVINASGVTYEEYGFDEGDPLGEQSIDVYINGQLAKTIKYTVVPADDSGSGN